MHIDLEEQLPFLIEQLSSTESGHSLETRWKHVLEKFFSLARLDSYEQELERCRIINNGLSLQIPAINHNLLYELSVDNAELAFNDNDIQLAEALLKISRQFISVQEAIDRGANEERQRIARDLHDDVAARMLTLIHRAKDQDAIDLARSILKSLRNAIYTLDNKSTTTILHAITDIRSELQDRLNSIGMQLIWNQDDSLAELTFTPRQHINLHRILHEIATNVLRHAEADYIHVDIDVDNDQFHLHVCDNGKGFDINHCVPGKGINNIRTRIKELDGKVEWLGALTNNNKGCCLDIRFPLTTSQK
ncbi:MAG TPA: ATP-binding protein [Gammaproteobacteria bacterium]